MVQPAVSRRFTIAPGPELHSGTHLRMRKHDTPFGAHEMALTLFDPYLSVRSRLVRVSQSGCGMVSAAPNPAPQLAGFHLYVGGSHVLASIGPPKTAEPRGYIGPGGVLGGNQGPVEVGPAGPIGGIRVHRPGQVRSRSADGEHDR